VGFLHSFFRFSASSDYDRYLHPVGKYNVDAAIKKFKSVRERDGLLPHFKLVSCNQPSLVTGHVSMDGIPTIMVASEIVIERAWISQDDEHLLQQDRFEIPSLKKDRSEPFRYEIPQLLASSMMRKKKGVDLTEDLQKNGDLWGPLSGQAFFAFTLMDDDSLKVTSVEFIWQSPDNKPKKGPRRSVEAAKLAEEELLARVSRKN